MADAANFSLLKSDLPPRENSGTDVERLMDKFNLDLPLVARLGGLSQLTYRIQESIVSHA